MKKFLTVLLVALLGAMPPFADDAADVKAVIVSDFELQKAGDFAGKLALYAPDYLEMDPDGKTIDYKQAKLVMQAFDGKHPKAILLLVAMEHLKGAEIPPDMMARIDETARNPEFVKQYEAAVPNAVAMLKAEADLELKTLAFVSVKVEGDKAVALVEYDSKDPKTGEIKRKVVNVSLRKTDGKWLFYRSVIKFK